MEIPQSTMSEWSFWHRAFYIFFPRFLVPFILGLYFQFEVNHDNHLHKFPEGTPVIYCINHKSHLDGFIAGSAVLVPRGPRTRVSLMGAGNIMQENWFYRLLPYFGAFPVYPKKSEAGVNYAVKVLKQGIGLVLAPQGKRIIGTPYHDYFNLAKEGRTGVGRIILLMNGKVPVIPTYIQGSAEALSKGELIPRIGSPISVSFGPPLFWNEFTRKNGWKSTDSEFFPTARIITDRIMAKIRELMIKREKPFFRILERIYGAKIDEIIVSEEKKGRFEKLVSKLVRTHPQLQQQLLEKVENNRGH